jgi:transcriptional regulator GlxA family with amidase domain
MSLTPPSDGSRLAGVRARQVVIVIYPGMQSLDALGPLEVLAGASRVVGSSRRGGYSVRLVSADGRPVQTGSGVVLGAEPLPADDEPIDTLVLPGGDQARAARSDGSLVTWIRGAAPRSRRVATVCTGAFLAAEAGLLAGRRVTTHWAWAEQLAEEYPDLHVDADPIYLRDGKYWTSAGVTAGIDLALALVDDDHGGEVAQTVARWLVMFRHRPGGQTQFASPVWVPRAERSTVRAVQTLVESAPAGDHRLPALAAAAAMSVRHFTRVFTDQVGETPGRFVERVRLEAARHELESTSDTLDLIADRCGFGSAETLRRTFQRRLNVAPDHYRRRFRTGGTERRSA